MYEFVGRGQTRSQGGRLGYLTSSSLIPGGCCECSWVEESGFYLSPYLSPYLSRITQFITNSSLLWMTSMPCCVGHFLTPASSLMQDRLVEGNWGNRLKQHNEGFAEIPCSKVASVRRRRVMRHKAHYWYHVHFHLLLRHPVVLVLVRILSL